MIVSFAVDFHVGKMCRLLGEERGLRAHADLLALQLRESRRDGATHLAVMGDLFDTPFPTQAMILLVARFLHRCRDMDVVVFPGNHDVQDAAIHSLMLLAELPRFGALRHVRFVTQPETIEWGSLRALVLPWGSRPPARHDASLVLFHDDVVGAKNDNGQPCRTGLRPDAFGDVTAVSGHLHTPQRVGRTWFPGTLAQLSFGERGERRLLRLEAGRREHRVTSRPVRPPWSLETVRYDARDPPSCDAPDTYYSLKIGEDPVPPRWLVEHPQVLKTDGAKRGGAQAGRVVRLMADPDDRADSRADESELVSRYLRQHSSLDGLWRGRALRLHERLVKGT